MEGQCLLYSLPSSHKSESMEKKSRYPPSPFPSSVPKNNGGLVSDGEGELPSPQNSQRCARGFTILMFFFFSLSLSLSLSQLSEVSCVFSLFLKCSQPPSHPFLPSRLGEAGSTLHHRAEGGHKDCEQRKAVRVGPHEGKKNRHLLISLFRLYLSRKNCIDQFFYGI